MRDLTSDDARRGVIGGGVFACGGGGWQHHGELMGHIATSIGVPQLASVDELPEDAWVATVTAIGAPASPTWEIRPVDYVHALQALMEHREHPIAAVMTAQNGYSTTHNGWIQSAVLGVKVLDAAGDVRAHPTGKLGSLGLTTRPGYVSTQVVSGGNRALHGHFLSVNRGTVSTCDDVLRDISVRTGGFIASARNVVELSWVKEHAALGSISLALDLGGDMEQAGVGDPGQGEDVAAAVIRRLGGTILDRGPLSHAGDDPRPGPAVPRGAAGDPRRVGPGHLPHRRPHGALSQRVHGHRPWHRAGRDLSRHHHPAQRRRRLPARGQGCGARHGHDPHPRAQ